MPVFNLYYNIPSFNVVDNAIGLRCSYRNFLFAPSSTNSYEFSTFTGIRDAFADYLKARRAAAAAGDASERESESRQNEARYDENEARVAVERQMSVVTLAIQSAYSVLSEEEYFQ